MSSTSPQHHLPLCVPVLPNGVSPQASKSNQSTQIQWEFIGNWFCSEKTLLIRWTEMISFDPLSAEEVQTPFLTRKRENKLYANLEKVNKWEDVCSLACKREYVRSLNEISYLRTV